MSITDEILAARQQALAHGIQPTRCELNREAFAELMAGRRWAVYGAGPDYIYGMTLVEVSGPLRVWLEPSTNAVNQAAEHLAAAAAAATLSVDAFTRSLILADDAFVDDPPARPRRAIAVEGKL